MRFGFSSRNIITATVIFFLAEGTMASQRAELVARQGPGASVSIPDSSTPTNSADTPAVSPFLLFIFPSDLTSCTSASIEWAYMGPSQPMSLIVSSFNVPSTSTLSRTFTDNVHIGRRAVPTGASTDTAITMTLAIGLDPIGTTSFNWSPVNLPPGSYAMQASIPSLNFQNTKIFSVNSGSDTSCLSTASTTAPPSTTGTSITATSSTASSSDTSIPSPVSGASSSSPNTGLIAGVSVAGVALLAAALAAYLCLRRKGKSTAAKSRGGWGGLGSTDSKSHKMKRNSKKSLYAAAGVRSQRHHSQADSLGPIVGVAGSAEAVGSVGYGGSEEKFSSSSTPGHGTSPFDDAVGGVALVDRNHSLRGSRPAASRTYSYSSTASLSHATPMPNDYSGVGRRPSVPDSVMAPHGGRRPSIDSSTTYPPSPNTAYPAGAAPPISPTSSVTTQPQGQSFNPYYTASDMHRSQSSATHATASSSMQSLAQGTTAAAAVATPSNKTHRSSSGAPSRKTPRKPVPAYASTSPAPSASPPTNSPITPSSSSSASTPYSSSVPSYPSSSDHHQSYSQPPTGHSGHYTTRTQSQPGVGRRSDEGRELVHKSSFGPGGVEGKALHYLIPDMPLDVKD